MSCLWCVCLCVMESHVSRSCVHALSTKVEAYAKQKGIDMSLRRVLVCHFSHLSCFSLSLYESRVPRVCVSISCLSCVRVCLYEYHVSLMCVYVLSVPCVSMCASTSLFCACMCLVSLVWVCVFHVSLLCVYFLCVCLFLVHQRRGVCEHIGHRSLTGEKVAN